MTFLSQSTAKIYVSFHTHGLCFWLNCVKSPVLDSLLAASLTFATTSWEVALSCATTRLVSEKANRATPRTTRTLLVFMILPFLRHGVFPLKSAAFVAVTKDLRLSTGIPDFKFRSAPDPMPSYRAASMQICPGTSWAAVELLLPAPFFVYAAAGACSARLTPWRGF